MILALALLVLPQSQGRLQAEPPPTLEWHAEIDQLLKDWHRPEAPGAVVGVIEAGEWIYQRCFGFANLEIRTELDPSSVFNVASLSKQFTAACVAILIQRGQLSSHTKLRSLMPSFPSYGQAITIAHLLHHTSGVRDYMTLMRLQGQSLEAPLTSSDALELLIRQSALNFQPGTEYLYSNSGYVLLAEVVRRASGAPLARFAQSNLFVPLEMSRTRFVGSHSTVITGRVASYGNGERTIRRYLNGSGILGDGNLLTCLEDLGRWESAWTKLQVPPTGAGGALDAALRRTLERGRLADGRELPYAYGLIHAEHLSQPTIGHGGAFLGFRAAVLRLPRQSFSVVVLGNFNALPAESIARQIAEVVLRHRHAVEIEPTPAEERGDPSTVLTLAELNDLAGTYRHGGTGRVVKVQSFLGQLLLQSGSRSAQLVPLGGRRFRSAEDSSQDQEFEFIDAEEDGERYLVARTQGEVAARYRRVVIPAMDPEALEEFRGAFHCPDLGTTFNLLPRAGGLVVRCAGNYDGTSLEPVGEDRFQGRFLVSFRRDTEGQVRGFELSDRRVRHLLFFKKTPR